MPRKATPSTEVTVWSDAVHAPLIGRLLDVMGGAIKVLAVGGARVAAVADLARGLGHEPTDDLRHMLVSHPAAFVLIGSTDPLSDDDLSAAARAGAVPLCIEPPAADFDELAQVQRKDASIAPWVFAPLMTASPGFVRAAHPFEALGDRRTLTIESVGPAGAGSVFARLFDAWLTALRFIELPQAIDAQFTPVSPDDDQTPDSPRRLCGRITAHGRTGEGASVLLLISDRAPEHHRRVLVMGDQAQIQITDRGYQLHAADGSPFDQASEAGPAPSYADLIAAQWQRLIEQGQAGTNPAEPAGGTPLHAYAGALACCLACLLSARTGQPEDPNTLQRLR